MDLDSFLVSLYVLVDDWWQAGHGRAPRRPGRPALLTDPEVLEWRFPVLLESFEIRRGSGGNGGSVYSGNVTMSSSVAPSTP